MLNVKELKEYYEARPFKPFEIVLTDGRRLRVDQPEYVGWSVTAGTIVHANHKGTFDEVPMSLVTNVRPVPANGKGNRRSRRRRGDH